MENNFKIFNLQDISHKQLITGNKEFSLSAVISDLIGFKKIFIHHDILSSGKSSSSFHAHLLKEEMVVVLEGRPSVCIKGMRQELRPGDFIGFKPNEGHLIENMNAELASFLVICSNDAEDKVIYGK